MHKHAFITPHRTAAGHARSTAVEESMYCQLSSVVVLGPGLVAGRKELNSIYRQIRQRSSNNRLRKSEGQRKRNATGHGYGPDRQGPRVRKGEEISLRRTRPGIGKVQDFRFALSIRRERLLLLFFCHHLIQLRFGQER